MYRYSAFAILFGTAGILAGSNARAVPAVCLPDQSTYPISVGDTASDHNCDFDTIQDAIDSLGACPATIAITREHLYKNQHLVISNKSVTLEGLGDGVSCPGPIAQGTTSTVTATPIAPVVTIDGSASNDFSVLAITGNSHVTLKYLEITGGAATGDGGGIHFEGTGSLTLDTSTIDANHAGYGGGINFHGTGDADHVATLTLGANTLIGNNTADTSGGGIRIEGQARLFALKPQTTIVNNHAPGGYGGGVEVLGPARTDIGSPGYGGVAVLYDNDARDGGGIAIMATAQGSATARFFTTVATQPVKLDSNSATNRGGAVYLRPAESSDAVTGASLCMYDFRIVGNQSVDDGVAIFADTNTGRYTDHGSSVYLNPAGPCGPETPASLGATACAPGTPCNDISGNNEGTLYEVSLLNFHVFDQFQIHRVQMRDNHVSSLLQADDNFLGTSTLSDCLLADNDLFLAPLDLSDHFGSYEITNCTIAHNTIHYGEASIYFTHDEQGGIFRIDDSIIDDPGVAALDYQGDPDHLQVNYVLSNEVDSLPASGTGIVLGEPDFMDAAHGDYHLAPDSWIGLDFAPAGGGIDLDGRPRDVDLPGAGNLYGPRDLGAYERQSDFACDDSPDAIFCNGFEQL